MEKTKPSWGNRLANLARMIFWLILVYFLIQTVLQPSAIDAARTKVLEKFQQERKSRVIAMINRQETINILGVPVHSYITIEDSEAVLRAIRLTPDDQPIDMILHTPGGLVLAAEQIAKALLDHKGKVTVFIPHYAMSGGTLIALASDEIVMDPNAVLGPVDPQIGDLPAASILKLLEWKKAKDIKDEMLILTDIASKAMAQVTSFVSGLLIKHLPKEKASELATTLTEGRWTHDYPITVETARQLGLSISTDMPHVVYELMDLYPQTGAARPSVLYVPLRPMPEPQHQGAKSAREVPSVEK